MALLALVLVALREPLAQRLWPDTRLQRLLQQGELALRQGRLSSDDGSGARQQFEAALALDSDRGEAYDGLRRVGEAALAQARDALEQDDLGRAREALALALALRWGDVRDRTMLIQRPPRSAREATRRRRSPARSGCSARQPCAA
ncbi:MAG TPA: hypothetical protein VEY92_11490, partial [Pseudoxanthomonas sp.]|nr:hypothetical protein [Pseudoxanthomonas sp.]